MSRLFNNKKLMALFAMMILSLSVMLICLNTIATVIENENIALDAKSGKYRISAVRTKLNDLDTAMAGINPPYMQKDEARRFITETAENIKNLYKGKFTSVVRDENSSLSIDMEFVITPPAPEYITKITDYFENSTAPIIFIKQFQTAKNLGKEQVTFKITMTQPYYGGQYVY